MDKRTEKGRGALMTHHQSLRSLLIIQNILPALHSILTDVEYSRVDGKEGNVAQVDEFIKILLTKEFRHFEMFCTVLANNGYEHWAKTLREEVREEAREEFDIGSEARPRGTCEQLLSPGSQERHNMAWSLLPSHTIPLKPMHCELQVVSSIMHGNKVYITGMGIAKDKGAKDNVPKDHVSRQIQVYPLDGVGNWFTWPEDQRQKPVPKYNVPVVIINGHLTLVGGRDAEEGTITNTLSAWNEEKGEWEHNNPPPMPSKRLASGVCHHNDYLLVVGGVVDDEVSELVNTVDVYNFSSKCWSTPEALDLRIDKLRSPHVVVFKEYVYVIGGSTTYPTLPEKGEGQCNHDAWRARWSDVKEAVAINEAIEAAVKQDAQTHTAGKKPSKEVKSVWRKIADPPVVRPTVVSCESFLLLIGGVKDGIPQEGIYKFSVEKDVDKMNIDGCGSWTLVGNMSVGRYLHAVVPLGSHGTTLFIAGGSVLSSPDEIERHKESSSSELVIL